MRKTVRACAFVVVLGVIVGSCLVVNMLSLLLSIEIFLPVPAGPSANHLCKIYQLGTVGISGEGKAFPIKLSLSQCSHLLWSKFLLCFKLTIMQY